MSSKVRIVARAVSVAGLAALSALHVIWASGSSWPAKSTERLAEAVVGQTVEMPGRLPTAVIAAGAAGAACLVSGGLGERGIARFGARFTGTAMLLRAVLGGDVALAALGLPPSSQTFRRLDRRYYRPFAALLGGALWIASSRDRKHGA